MRNKIFIIIFLFVLFLLVSCSARYIRVNSLNHTQEVYKGDTVTFSWDISNADYVKIEGVDKKFKATDYFKIFAESTTNFILTAYHGKKDSIKRNLNLIVKPREAISGIDDTKKDEFKLMTTVDSSYYYPAIKDYSDGFTFSGIKITSIFKESDKSEEYKIRFILLDNFGNFLNNVDLNKSGLQLSLSQTYGPDKYTHIYNKIKSSLNIPSDICILIDNSISPSNQQDCLLYTSPSPRDS